MGWILLHYLHFWPTFSLWDQLICPLIHLEWPSLLGWVHDFKYLSRGCRKRAVLWKGCRFKALRNIWSSEEDLHFCNDSISADVTNILFWQMLSYPWLTTTYCYFRRYYILRWNNTITQIQLVTYKSPIKRSTWSWNKKKKDHLTVQRCFVSKAYISVKNMDSVYLNWSFLHPFLFVLQCFFICIHFIFNKKRLSFICASFYMAASSISCFLEHWLHWFHWGFVA